MTNGTRIKLWRAGIVSFIALLASAATLLAGGPNSQGKILAGFFEEWSIYYANYNIADLQNNGAADKLSHFIYAFANVSADSTNPSLDTCTIADSWADYQTPYLPPVGNIPDTAPLYGNFAEILKLKQLHPRLRTLISLGGANATNTTAFSTAATTQAGRQALASSCLNMFITGNVASGISAPGLFDGIHIDWEFPTATDTQNFTLLLQEFRKQLNALGKANGKYYELSFDGPAGEQNYSNIDLAATAKLVDFITIDGYNYNGTWENVANHASPLFDSRKDPEFGEGLCIACTVNAYLSAGVPPSKCHGRASVWSGVDRHSERESWPLSNFYGYGGWFVGGAGPAGERKRPVHRPVGRPSGMRRVVGCGRGHLFHAFNPPRQRLQPLFRPGERCGVALRSHHGNLLVL